jgi:hypothetical protein
MPRLERKSRPALAMRLRGRSSALPGFSYSSFYSGAADQRQAILLLIITANYFSPSPRFIVRTDGEVCSNVGDARFLDDGQTGRETDNEL